MTHPHLTKVLSCVLLTTLALGRPAAAVSNGFTFQGYLRLEGTPVSGSCDFRFRLFDAPEGGAQIGITQPASGIAVSDGVFTIRLDLGSQPFNGNDRYLEMDVRCNSTGAYTTLLPRQPLTATPYALYANAAGIASNLTCSSCISAAQIATASIEGGDIEPGAIQQYHLAFTPGTVRSVMTGTGLTGGVITDTGTISIVFGNSAGTVAEGNHVHNTGYWKTGGNAATDPNSQFIGTIDNQPLELRVNAQRALRLQPGTSPTVIAGWAGNTAEPSVAGATIGGGGAATDGGAAGDGGGAGGTMEPGANHVFDDFGTIAGGLANSAGLKASVGGGWANFASGSSAVVGGGFGNEATGNYATIGGGGRTDVGDTSTGNLVTDDYGTIGGGGDNQVGNSNPDTTDAVGGTVCGGGSNTASAPHATVSGGFLNAATGLQAAVGGGSFNNAIGAAATIPGGFFNSADGAGSLAAGINAHANHDGSFVWSDGTDTVSSNGLHQFIARATGGFRFVFSAAGGHCDLNSIASGWQCSFPSDRDAKRDTAAVDNTAILDRLANVPIQTWSYKTEEVSVRHIGPMAQDFHAAFQVGENDREINTADANGVTMAAIQGLYRIVRERDDTIVALQRQVAILEKRLAELEHR